MATIEVTPDSDNMVSIDVEKEPSVDAVAHEATKINALVDANSGVDPTERMSDETYNPVETFVRNAERVRAEQMAAHREVLNSNALPTDASDAEIQAYRGDLGGANGLLGVYRQKALEMNNGLPSENTDELAFSMMYRMEMAKYFSESNLLDVASDVPGLLVPMREGINVAQLGEDLGFTDTTMEKLANFADPGSLMDDMHRMAINLAPEDRAKMFEAVMHSLKDLDNNLIKQQLVSAIFSGSYDPAAMTFFNAFDVADSALAVGAIAKVGASLAKTGKMINLYKKVPTIEGYELLSKVASEASLAKQAGVSPAEIADLHNPLLHGERGFDITGAPDDVASEITAMWSLQDKRIESLNERSLREGVLSEQRQREVMVEAEEAIRKERYVTDLETIKTDTGFTIKFTENRYDPLTQKMSVVKDEVHSDFLVDSQGRIEADMDAEYVNGLIRFDPNARLMGEAQEQLVSSGETITREQGKVINTLFNSLKDAYGKLSKKEVAKINDLLLKGSKEGKEYSYAELKSMGYSDKLSKAYFGQRNLTYHMYNLEDAKLRDAMISEGVRLIDTGEAEVAGRHFEDVDAAKEAYRTFDSDSWSVLVMDDGLIQGRAGTRLDFSSPGEFTGNMLEDAYARGFQLVKNYHHNTRFQNGDSITEWALVRPNRVVHPRGRRVINRVPGYVPKARKDAFYFIKDKRISPVSNPKQTVSGPKHSEITLGWADNIADAEAYARKLGLDPKTSVKFDRELNPETLRGDLLLTRGGLFGGKRKTEELPYVGKNESYDYEDSLEMMQRYINHLGRQLPAHLWRIGNEQRVIQKAQNIMPGANIRNIRDVIPQAEEYLSRGSKEYSYLKDMVEQIQNINAIPTADEVAMSKKFERIGNYFEGIPSLSWMSKYFYRAAQSNLNIADKIRGVTFTHMLGMYNPAQFLVQASGAMVAFAVNPVAFSKALPKMIGWQMLDGFASDPLNQKRAADWLRSQGMGDYADSYMVWHKSGFREAVVDSNADMATMFGKKPFNAGVLNRLMERNTLFYEMGELAMSRASVATAIEWYKGAKGVSKIDLGDTAALKEIYRRAEQYRLNMGRANRSSFNKGWKAVPLQFQQVISKYYAKVLPSNLGGTGEFTAAEKIRLFAIPSAITGAAAIPASDFILEAGVNLLNAAGADIELTQVSPEEAQLYKAGFAGWALSEAAGINVDFSSRMSLGQDIFKRVWESMQSGGGSTIAAALGPSGNVAVRWTQALQYLGEAINLTTEAETFTADEAILVGKVLGDALLSIPSSTRNMKSYIPHILSDNPAFIKDGRYMWDWEGMDTQTAIMAAMGFQPDEMVDLYDLANEMKGSNRSSGLTWLKTDKDVIAHIISTGILGTDQEHEQKLKAKIVNAILSSYEPADRNRLINDVYDTMYSPEKDVDDMFHQLRIHVMERADKGIQFINRTVSKKNAELNGGQ